MKRFLRHLPHHRIWQLGVDAGLVAVAWTLAFQLRFDQGLPVFYQTLFDRTIWIVVPVKVAVFVLFGFSNRWWRYFSSRDVWRTGTGVIAACVLADVIVYFAQPVGTLRLPRSIADYSSAHPGRAWPPRRRRPAARPSRRRRGSRAAAGRAAGDRRWRGDWRSSALPPWGPMRQGRA